VSVENVIIVRKKKGGHGGGHGGAWKVAFADFMTAMMAFFLVMWLVGQSKPIKVAVAGYFRNPGAFDGKGGGDGILDGSKGTAPDLQPGAEKSSAEERETLERSVDHIRERLNGVDELKTLRGQIEYTITKEGLRIDLLESDKSSFFDSGSAGLRPETVRILAIIAKELGTLNNSVIIEGHTDSHQYASKEGYGNWELSTDRANAARRVMQRDGLKQTQIAAVRGHADRELRVAADPFDPRNRRVSVIVKAQTKEGPAAK
jgi:chemotaxis protein MotB